MIRGGYSLRRRLGLALALGVAVAWLAGTVISGIVVRHELDEAFDSALQETAQRLLPLAVLEIIDNADEDDDGDEDKVRMVAPLGSHEEFLTYLVRSPDGRVILKSHDAEPAVFPDRPAHGFRQTPTHRIYGESALRGSMFIEVAEPLAHRRDAALESTLSLTLPLAVLLPVCFIGVWWLVRRSLAPVIGLGDAIGTRGAGDLSPVDAVALPDEIKPIADAVNSLLGRLQKSLETERGFAANSAHELRTPIAGALAQVQRLLATVAEGETRDRVLEIEATLQRLKRISEKLMQLARAEGGGVLAETPSDLIPVLDHVVAEFRRGGAGTRVRFDRDDGDSLVSRMDVDAFAILIRNLVENALKHAPPESPVEISVPAAGRVTVRNGGPAVDPELLSALTRPFVRGISGAEGSGLGLAIVRAIADGAGATLTLRSPASGRADGFEATVDLAGA